MTAQNSVVILMAGNLSGAPSAAEMTFLRANVAAAVELPPPEVRFQMGDVVAGMDGEPPADHDCTLTESEFKKLLANGVIVSAEERSHHHTSGKFWDTIVTLRTDRPTHECGHTGLLTVDAEAGVYRCARSVCDATLSRDQINMEAIQP